MKEVKEATLIQHLPSHPVWQRCRRLWCLSRRAFLPAPCFKVPNFVMWPMLNPAPQQQRLVASSVHMCANWTPGRYGGEHLALFLFAHIWQLCGSWEDLPDIIWFCQKKLSRNIKTVWSDKPFVNDRSCKYCLLQVTQCGTQRHILTKPTKPNRALTKCSCQRLRVVSVLGST